MNPSKTAKMENSSSPVSEKRNSCSFYVPHKKRFCKGLVAEGNQFCGQHLVGKQDESGRQFKRIPCPLDPKHSCYEHRIESHLNHCNARVVEKHFPYKLINCNLGPTVMEPDKRKLTELSDEQLLSIIDKIDSKYNEYVKDCIKEEIYHHPALDKEMESPEYVGSNGRHLRQNASLLGHIKNLGGLETEGDSSCIIEFGAGRGQLTRWIIEAMQSYENKKFLLIDRGARRHKQDAKLRHNPKINISRLKIDIQHLDLNGLEDVSSCQSLYGVGKHLCGAATDLSLRCLAEHATNYSNVSIIIALCCHHQCTWQAYTGKQFYLEDLNFTVEEFYILLAVGSWAVCGAQDTKADKSSHLPIIDDKNNIEGRYVKLELNSERRENIGRRAKQLLDYGRLMYLRGLGFQCKLAKYVDKELTLENIVLTGCKTKNKTSET